MTCDTKGPVRPGRGRKFNRDRNRLLYAQQLLSLRCIACRVPTSSSTSTSIRSRWWWWWGSVASVYSVCFSSRSVPVRSFGYRKRGVHRFLEWHHERRRHVHRTAQATDRLLLLLKCDCCCRTFVRVLESRAVDVNTATTATTAAISKEKVIESRSSSTIYLYKWLVGSISFFFPFHCPAYSYNIKKMFMLIPRIITYVRATLHSRIISEIFITDDILSLILKVESISKLSPLRITHHIRVRVRTSHRVVKQQLYET